MSSKNKNDDERCFDQKSECRSINVLYNIRMSDPMTEIIKKT